MEDYRLTQTGAEVQAILDGAAMQVDLTAENERAELAEQTLQGHIDEEETRAKAAEKQNADDIDAIEEKIPSGATSSNKMATASDISTLQDNIDAEETRAKAAEKQNADDIDAIEAVLPSGATSENKLATEEYVNDSVATNTATFRGTFNLVSDLHLAVDATHAQIAYQLPTLIAVADNNDYCFVLIPTSSETPTQIQAIERYKYNGSAWAFEYTLNNSGFTATQWATINSGITSGDVSKLAALPTNAELTTLLNGKQNVLTFDSVPTQGSNNPVKSGGVYSAIDDEKGARLNSDAALQLSIDGINAKIPSGASSDNKMATESEITTLSQAIEAILLLIPSAATALNQLADKAFVNSSISTATATFRGTYNLVSDLSLAVNATHAQIATALAGAVSNADSNDYAFVQIPTSADTPTEIRVTERYKFNGTEWSYEYDLNNSGFTADQWAAINSGITQLLVSKLLALPTAAELTTALAGKQATLTFDNVPTSGSSNPVKSGGVYSAIQDVVSNITAIINQMDATFNLTTTDDHITLHVTQVNGVITSVQVQSSDIASAAALTLVANDLSALTTRVGTAEGNITSLTGRMTTAEGDIETLQDLYNALQQSAPQVIQPTDTWPVANPSNTVIYRVIDRVNTPPQYYSDYMWNGTSMVLMATYNNAIDTTPKKDSANLITSGGVFANIGAFDVSEYHKSGGTLATYVDLSAALAAVPTDYQKGGMSVKFVQSSDNKYVQARLMANAFTTDITKWQGVDEEPTVGSNNLVKSGGVLSDINSKTGNLTWVNGKYINTAGTEVSNASYKHSEPILLLKNQSIHVTSNTGGSGTALLCSYNNGSYTPILLGVSSTTENKILIAQNGYYIISVNMNASVEIINRDILETEETFSLISQNNTRYGSTILLKESTIGGSLVTVTAEGCDRQLIIEFPDNNNSGYINVTLNINTSTPGVKEQLGMYCGLTGNRIVIDLPHEAVGKMYSIDLKYYGSSSIAYRLYSVKNLPNEFLNVSSVYPTGGISGTMYYDLDTAIQKVTADNARLGMILAFSPQSSLVRNGENVKMYVLQGTKTGSADIWYHNKDNYHEIKFKDDTFDASYSFPDGGPLGNGRYDLWTAARSVPVALRYQTQKVRFVNPYGEVEVWQYMSSNFNDNVYTRHDNWVRVDVPLDYIVSCENRLANPLYETRESWNANNPNEQIDVTTVHPLNNSDNILRRIPTCIITNAGTYLTATQKQNNPGGDFGEFSIEVSRKTENGEWTSSVVVPYISDTLTWRCNTSFVVERDNSQGHQGRIYLFFGSFSGIAVWWEQTTASSDFTYIYSDDDGVTWSEIQSLKSGWDTDVYKFTIPSCTNGIQLEDGTLVIPCMCVLKDSTQFSRSHILYKTPSGSWTFSSTIPTTNTYIQMDECDVIEDSANSVALMVRRGMRSYDPTNPLFKYNFSNDTWSEMHCTFAQTISCCMSLDKFQNNGQTIFLMSAVDPMQMQQSGRANITVWASLDLDRWIRVYRVYKPAGNGYSVVSNHNNKFIIVYEAGATIQFQDISVIEDLIVDSIPYLNKTIGVQDRMQILFNKLMGPNYE